MSNTTTTNAKKKALLITTVSGFVPQFEMNNVRILQEMGYEVHYATNYNMPSYGNDNHRLDGTGIIRHQIDFVRSPFDPSNIKIFRQLCQVMRDESFSLVHCHTPMGGVMARLASHHTHTGPVIYTAHGFHFFKGAHLVNWLFYYPMERFLSRFTLQQLCINQEDYHRAKRCFHARYVDYIPGAGIDLNRIPEYSEEKNLQKRRELGIPDNAIFLLSSGELIKRKNHETVLRALAKLRQDGTPRQLALLLPDGTLSVAFYPPTALHQSGGLSSRKTLFSCALCRLYSRSRNRLKSNSGIQRRKESSKAQRARDSRQCDFSAFLRGAYQTQES